MNRKFSVPYNLSDPQTFLNAINPYNNYIDHFYFGIPSIGYNYHSPNVYFNGIHYSESILKKQENAENFLTITQGKYKRFLTLNALSLNMFPEDKQLFIYHTIIPFLEKYNIEGMIITDIDVCKILHKAMPNLILSTSCNSFIWTKREMDYWANAGASLFNPPRESLRMPHMLEYFRNTGYKLKYLINESCVFGCPYCMQHLADAFNNIIYDHTCYHCNRGNALRASFVIPRWLDKLDKYVDIYKLSGRLCTTNYIVTALDAYSNDLNDIMVSQICNGPNVNLKINVKDIPDKLLTCECNDCKHCGLCDTLINENNLDVTDISYF